MNDKSEIMTMLRKEFELWEDMLSQLSEKQLTTANLPGGMSIKDELGHLWAWQQLSIARLDAALHDKEPEFDLFPDELDSEVEEDTDAINAWIYKINEAKSWETMHGEWKDGFLKVIALADAISADDWFDAKKYPWLNGYALSAVLTGTHEHHYEDHRLPLLEWLHGRGYID